MKFIVKMRSLAAEAAAADGVDRRRRRRRRTDSILGISPFASICIYYRRRAYTYLLICVRSPGSSTAIRHRLYGHRFGASCESRFSSVSRDARIPLTQCANLPRISRSLTIGNKFEKLFYFCPSFSDFTVNETGER